MEPGDYSGPAGGRRVLATPGVQLGILETARGGILLKGVGISVNDVSVVTNVSADHLGLQGIDTVDQLAEVKAVVTKITKPTGWVVLNGYDPRVWAMRSGIKARPWVFSLDPDSPALRESFNLGGRAITVLDGDVVVLRPNGDPDHLLPIVDVPVTLSGLSEHNIANALAATVAALGMGLPREAVVKGLRTFAPDPLHNPGRMNVYSLPLTGGGQTTVIIDLAHNEAGLEALLRVAEGLRPPGPRSTWGLEPPATGPMRSCRGWVSWPADGPTGCRLCTRWTICVVARWWTSRRSCGSACRGSGSPRSTLIPQSSTGCRPWSRRPTLMTCSR